MAQTDEPVITYDYDFSPYGQKIRLALELAGIPYKRVDVPSLLPRPGLEKIGVTYRRIPVVSVGKDVYADTSIIMDKILKLQGPKGKVHDHPAAKAFQEWSNNVFTSVLALIPGAALTPEFVKDREHIFPFLMRKDLPELQPSTEGTFYSQMSTVENDFLSSDYPYIGGRNEPSVADIHVIWVIRFYLEALGVGQRPGFGKETFPRTYAWLDKFPHPSPAVIDDEEAKKVILGAAYDESKLSNQKEDKLQQFLGKEVSVENADTTPGTFPQVGRLVSSSQYEFAIQLENGIRLHFPRWGYFVKQK